MLATMLRRHREVDTNGESRGPELRELDRRVDEGLIVTLEWDCCSGHVQVRCESEYEAGRPAKLLPVDPTDAWFAFLHPFALRTLQQIRTLAEPEDVRDDPVGAGESKSCGKEAVDERRWCWQWWLL
jgi:hypothetical protein